MSGNCGGCRGSYGIDNQTLYVRSPQDLMHLKRTYKRYKSIKIISNTIPPKDKFLLEEKLYSNYSECGCELGGISLLLALLGIIVILVFLQVKLTAFNSAIAFSICLLFALLGKILGITISRFKLHKQLQELMPYL
jgi:hypothetical protein